LSAISKKKAKKENDWRQKGHCLRHHHKEPSLNPGKEAETQCQNRGGEGRENSKKRKT